MGILASGIAGNEGCAGVRDERSVAFPTQAPPNRGIIAGSLLIRFKGYILSPQRTGTPSDSVMVIRPNCCLVKDLLQCS